MSDVKKIVYDALKEVFSESNVDMEPYDDLELNRESGIDSLGIVTLVVLLEEKLKINCDQYLANIRNCKRVIDLVNLMEKISKDDKC